MFRLRIGAAAAIGCALVSSPAWAHVVCGDRVFPATLIMDDPGVGDEISLPTVQYNRIPAKAGGGEFTDYGFEWDKTITEHFGFALNGDYPVQTSGGTSVQGWDNFTLTLKDEFLCSESNEFAASVGVIHEFGGTGTLRLVNAGVIDPAGSTAPTFYFGKGLGDLLPGYLRPLAVTGELGYAISDTPSVSPDAWQYSASLQYSIPYLQQHVKDLGLPTVVSNMDLVVESTFNTPTGFGLQTTGTIAPGILYVGDTFQVGLEATIPATKATWQNQGLGFIAQFHLFLDDIEAAGPFGKPLF
jgi:hypothetical protein